jgi:hypothetical protein
MDNITTYLSLLSLAISFFVIWEQYKFHKKLNEYKKEQTAKLTDVRKRVAQIDLLTTGRFSDDE